MTTATAITPTSWDLLDEKDELELHKHRLLNVEEKPFKRITKRLIAVSTIATGPSSSSSSFSSTSTPPTPNDATQAAPATTTTPTPSRSEFDLLKEDLLLDFAAFESSIARLQFLLDANARERERYQADQARIVAESAAVREHNAALHAQLAGARATLAQRKRFDEMAERITSNRALRPRGEQRAALLRLEAECAELERESENYKVTWRERRDQFARIMDEGMSLRRLIRDEKEEVERREGMNEEEDAGGEDGDAGGGGVNGGGGGGGEVAVAASAGARTPLEMAGLRGSGDAGTPRPATSLGARTPLHDGSQPPGGGSTAGDGSHGGGLLGPVVGGDDGSRAGSRAPSTAGGDDGIREEDSDEEEVVLVVAAVEDDGEDDGEVKEGDVDMYDDSQPQQRLATPSIAVDAPDGDDRMEVDTN